VTQSSLPIRVYYEDTDAGGVVYHASYICFFERARTEWLRACGFSQTRLIEEQGLLFSVVNLEVQYLKPARLDDLLQVRSRIAVVGGASITFEQDIQRNESEMLTRATVLVACLDARTMRPKRLPATLRERFN
jgi:acyl-CoA thioester hydrolase